MASSGIVIYTDTHCIHGQIDSGERRLSDLLNDGRSAYLELLEVQCKDLLAESPIETPHAGVVLRKEGIRLVIPMDVPRPQALARMPIRRRPLTLSLGLFTVTGTWHLTADPTAQLVPMLEGYSRRFVPLTDGSVRYLPNDRYDTTGPVLLVNTGCIDMCIPDQADLQFATSLQVRTASMQ